MLPILAFLFTIAHNVNLYSQFRSGNLLLSNCGLIGIPLIHHIINVIASVVGAMIISFGIVFGRPLCITYGVVGLVPVAICNCLAIFMFYNDKIINAASGDGMLAKLGVVQLGIILSIVNETRNVQLLAYVIVITSTVYAVGDNTFAMRRRADQQVNMRVVLGMQILQCTAAVCILVGILFGSINGVRLGMIFSLPFVIHGLLKQRGIKNFHLYICMSSILLDAMFG